MTRVRLLYDLQELDQRTEQCWNQLYEVEARLADRQALERLQVRMEEERVRVRRLRLDQRESELSNQSLRQKAQVVEGKLYGGSVRSPRELQGLEMELKALRADLAGRDDRLLEAMAELEDAQRALASLKAEAAGAEAEWKESQTSLKERKKALEAELEDLQRRRQELASRVEPQELRLYENLKATKAGLAVARVEQGLCRGCRMALPTHQLQRARAGREPVLCGSCGRILYVS